MGGECLLATMHEGGHADAIDPDVEHSIGSAHETLHLYSDGVWWAWSLFIDPASMPEAMGFSTRVVAAVIVIIGVAYFAVFLALIVDAVQEKMKRLKYGLSPVVERRHTVVLGYSEETPIIVREISKANESVGGGVIAILVDGDKSRMEHELRLAVHEKELRGTRVVFRHGSRLRAGDLRMVAVETARSVIILSDTSLDAAHADAEVLQVVLNLSTLRMKETNVVAQLRTSDSVPLLHLVTRGSVATLAGTDIVGRLMLMFARKPGLAHVYSTILGFDDSEFYTAQWPEIHGLRFSQLQALFPAAVPVGVVKEGGEVLLNPPQGYVCGPGDALVVLAEDEDTYGPVARQPSGECDALPLTAPCFLPALPPPSTPERILFVGWRTDMPHMTLLLDKLVPAGSELHVVSSTALAARDAALLDSGVQPSELKNVRMVNHVANSGSRRFWESVGLESFTAVIITSDTLSGLDVIHSDSSNLAVLLLLRGVQAAQGKAYKALKGKNNSSWADLRDLPGTDAPTPKAHAGIPLTPRLERMGGNHDVSFGISDRVARAAKDLPVVVEILDPRTQRTVNASFGMLTVSDFIQSNDLLSKILAMVSEDVHVKRILDNLLGESGTQFVLLPASQVVSPDSLVSFLELSAHCATMRSSTLCGYIAAGAGGSAALEVCHINPPHKSIRCSWEGRALILIATDLAHAT